jgi:16S rRNA (guanine966-N2)-methyltransferase
VTRIVAGIAGGRRLRTPDGDRTRPTSGRVREAVFSTIESLMGSWDGVHVLDLYAGSGALGLEALSRGARSAVFVESHRRTAGLVEVNARELGLGEASVAARTAQQYVQRSRRADELPFDVVFADPPYAVHGSELTAICASLVTGDWLADGAVLVLERASRSEEFCWPEGLQAVRHRAYGDTALWYGRRSDTPSQREHD